MRLLFFFYVFFLNISYSYADTGNNINFSEINSDDYLNTPYDDDVNNQSEYVFNQIGNYNDINFISEYALRNTVTITQQGHDNISNINILNTTNSQINLSQNGTNNHIDTAISGGIDNNITVLQTGSNNSVFTNIYNNNNSQLIIIQNGI